jgi:hypothetical protein
MTPSDLASTFQEMWLTRQGVQQSGHPICFLYSRVEFPVLFGKIIGLLLDRRNAHRTDELHFGTCNAALRGCGRSRKFTICVVADLQDVPFGKGVSQHSVSEARCGVGSVDALNEDGQILSRSFQLGLQFDRVLFRLITFLNSRVLN